jgi:hypothetical protein
MSKKNKVFTFFSLQPPYIDWDLLKDKRVIVRIAAYDNYKLIFLEGAKGVFYIISEEYNVKKEEEISSKNS